MLVEDEAAIRQIMQRFISSTGHVVTAAENGETAEGLLASGLKPDILVTDLVMPGAIGGVELARRARNSAPDLPIVIVSGYPTEARDLTREMAGNPPIVLQKPVSKSELVGVINDLASARMHLLN